MTMPPGPSHPPTAAGHLVEEAAGAGLRLLKSIRKQWPMVAALTLLATGLTFLYVKIAKPVYQARALVEINPQAFQPLGQTKTDQVDMGAGTYWDTREYYETQYKIIRSDRVLAAVVHDLGLANDHEYVGEVAPGSDPTQAALDVLRASVTVEPVKESRLVEVKVEDQQAERARRVCDSVVKTYIDQNLQTAVDASGDAVVWLSGQVEHIKTDLEQNENDLFSFKQRNELPSTSINEASNMLRVELQEYDTALTHIRTRKQELAARRAELLQVNPDHPDVLPGSELLASSLLQSLRGQYVEAQRQTASLVASGKGENHPLVKEATERAATTKDALMVEVRNIEGSVDRDLQIVSREEAGVAALFQTAKQRAVELNMKEIEYHRLDRTRSENEKVYALLIERMKDADLARMLNVNNIRVVDHAIEPRVPIRPRAKIDVAAGLALGLLLGIALAWLRDILDSSVKTPDDVEHLLGVTFVGLLPEYEGKDGTGKNKPRRRRMRNPNAPLELIVHDDPLSGVAEAARTIRTNLAFINPDHPCTVMLVSSAGPAEGKTTAACSVAIALAQGGQRVCLVDCDLRRPRMHRIFDRRGSAGVTSVVVGDVPIDEAIQVTPIDNLSVICAGPLPPNPADLLQSQRFKTFLAELAERFDRVIIDSPPLAAVTDAAILSRLVDGTLFVVRSFKTSRQLATHGLRALRDVGAPIIGAVLNAVKLGRPEYAYYYHYHYYREGRNYGPDESEQSAAAPPN